VIIPTRVRRDSLQWAARLANGQPLEIRPLRRDELEQLARHLSEPPDVLEELAGYAEIGPEVYGSTSSDSVLVAWTQTIPLGRVCVRWTGARNPSIATACDGIPEIHGLQVAPESRSQGLGAALVRSAEELALLRGRRSVGLGVALDNPSARKLYERLGYSQASLPTYTESYDHSISPTRPARIRERRVFYTKRLPEPTLVLFDIDGTLLTSQGAGRQAMLSAGRSLFGEEFDWADVEVNGRLDPLIWHDLARANGLAPSAELEASFRECYVEHLRDRLRHPGAVQPLPGVLPLIERLRATSGVTLGVLTGNYPETGRMKLRAGGLSTELFSICAWGDDGATRPELVPVARARYATEEPHALDPSQIVVIGDTPHDVVCALENGCRALAVATGRSTTAELRRAGAHRTEETLADTTSLVRWILGEPVESSRADEDASHP